MPEARAQLSNIFQYGSQGRRKWVQRLQILQIASGGNIYFSKCLFPQIYIGFKCQDC